MVICLTFLFLILGLSFFSGIIVLILTFILNFFLGALSNKYWTIMLKSKDQRMSSATEALNSIKMLKLYAWDKVFQNIVESKRAQEIR